MAALNDASLFFFYFYPLAVNNNNDFMPVTEFPANSKNKVTLRWSHGASWSYFIGWNVTRDVSGSPGLYLAFSFSAWKLEKGRNDSWNDNR